MIDETIITRSKTDVAKALYLIEESSGVLEVRIRGYQLTRSDAQNRLSHKWYSEAEKQIGDGVSQRAYCKLHFGVGILKAGDSKICEHFRLQYDAIIKPLDYELKMAAMLPPFDLPVTSLMTVKQFAQYLDEVERHYSSIGVTLSRPDDLYLIALMRGAEEKK